ncbi:DUF6223 family protein [Streptomyces sp. NPDC001515]
MRCPGAPPVREEGVPRVRTPRAGRARDRARFGPAARRRRLRPDHRPPRRNRRRPGGAGGVVLGALVLTRFTAPARRGARRRGAFEALAAGLAGTAVGVVNLSVADGGPGTGNGVVGGAAALVLGPLAAALAALALRRSHRAGAPSAHPSR